MTTIPAEWRPHKAIWTAWPSAADLWGEDLEPARAEVAAMIRALWDGGKGDKMRVLAHGREAEATAKLALGQAAEVIPGAFGDIWFRDTGPIFDSRRRRARLSSSTAGAASISCRTTKKSARASRCWRKRIFAGTISSSKAAPSRWMAKARC